ncbi:MAG: phosphoglucosamine mutase [Candidatus Aminicenantes bacterium]|nr:phosphoglucosamine mutase [Candidatus Aminicenantes bacterium]
MKDNLFGTDGIRSTAGAFPLDEASLLKLGAVIAHLTPDPAILIARDTRASGAVIEAQLSQGLGRRTRIASAGVLPTSGLAYLTRKLHFDFGIMISASHNPFSDNGIKIFNHRGEKICQRLENKISVDFRARKKTTPARPQAITAIANRYYQDFLYENGKDLAEQKMKIAVDCANGAASSITAPLCRRLGLNAAIGHARPNGLNINAGCGSTFPRALKKLVAEKKADLGMAFDGDADRVIFSDRSGNILEGDHALYIMARYLNDTEPSFNRMVVGTVMGNLGLERALNAIGIEFLRSGVGDKHVYRLMKKKGAILGGEPSGHIILRQRQTTGDGFLTALFFMKALDFFHCGADDILKQLRLFPQQTVNIRIRRRKDLKTWKTLRQAAREFEKQNGDQARLLIRYSGTEAMLRIMMEARDRNVIEKNMPIFQSLVENEIGDQHET